MRPLFFGNLVVVKWHLKFELPGDSTFYWGMSQFGECSAGRVIDRRLERRALRLAIATQRISKARVFLAASSVAG